MSGIGIGNLGCTVKCPNCSRQGTLVLAWLPEPYYAVLHEGDDVCLISPLTDGEVYRLAVLVAERGCLEMCLERVPGVS